MKKADFIKAVAEKTGMSQDAVSKVLGGQIEVITEELKAGNEVGITGFGTFKVSHRAERNGVNPKTWNPMKLPATKSPSFKAGKTLKDGIK